MKFPKRIYGKSLNISKTHKFGALELRKYQLKIVQDLTLKQKRSKIVDEHVLQYEDFIVGRESVSRIGNQLRITELTKDLKASKKHSIIKK